MLSQVFAMTTGYVTAHGGLSQLDGEDFNLCFKGQEYPRKQGVGLGRRGEMGLGIIKKHWNAITLYVKESGSFAKCIQSRLWHGCNLKTLSE